MTRFKTLSLAAALMGASVLATPALALDLGGTLGGTLGGGSGSIGGSIGGTLDTTIGAGDRLGRINGRTDRVIDRAQDTLRRGANAIEVPDASPEAVSNALKAAGYGDAALETPLGSGSASGSAEGELPPPASDAAPPVALPDPAATAHDAIDGVQTAKTGVVNRAAAALPDDTISVSGSASGEASAKKAAEEAPAADEPAPAPAENKPSTRAAHDQEDTMAPRQN